jgi:hypothetical protein
MPQSELRLIKQIAEFIPKADAARLPRMLRGIYVLYKFRRRRHREVYDVLYVGMAAAGRRGGLRSRLIRHRSSKKRGHLWTHFSAYEAWDNIRDEEIVELEGLFRHIYRKDSAANVLNIQRGFKKAKRLRQNDLSQWRSTIPAQNARKRSGKKRRRRSPRRKGSAHGGDRH